jgi:peptidoglycan/LPS O-acetylase OafA/YrhL
LRFYVRRFFRIAPLYYIILLPAFIWFNFFQATIQRFFPHTATVVYDPTVRQLTTANVAMHLSFLFGLSPKYCASLIVPDWSIGLEMQFYFLFPFLMLFARKFNLGKLTLLLGSVWLISVHLIGVYIVNVPLRFGLFPQPSFFPLKAGVFLIGMLLAWAYMEQGELNGRAAFLVLAAVGLAGFCRPFVFVSVIVAAFLLFYREPTAGLSAQALVKITRTVLANRIAGFLGNVSYGVYLSHMLILVPALSILSSHRLYAQQRASVRFLILALVVCGVAYPCSWLLFKFIETPGIQIGKSLSRRIKYKTTTLVA